jgi:hypothetical protein
LEKKEKPALKRKKQEPEKHSGLSRSPFSTIRKSASPTQDVARLT